MGCVRCGVAAEIGALCRACALGVAPCDGLIPDHIRSTIDPSDGKAWVIDGFGGAHAVAASVVIGRNQDSSVIVLASSVSREHAEVKLTDDGWTVRDLGSRNGTFVNGVRCQGDVALPLVALPEPALLKVGDVGLWFVTRVVAEPPRRPEMATGDAGGGLVRYHLMHDELELCIVAGYEVTAGGAVLWRTASTEPWSERSLAPLEFQLLRALCVRGFAEVGSPLAIRGCVPTKQLLRDLPFQSKYANQENVRQVVLRLRGVLAELGARGVLAVAPGRGYYLACAITARAAEVERR